MTRRKSELHHKEVYRNAKHTKLQGDLAFRCKYMSEEEASELDQTYDGILGQLVRMIERPEQWSIRTSSIRKTDRT